MEPELTTDGERFAAGSDSANAEYDYVVVGAGSAGCAFVRRLSDLTGARILLLEAGRADDQAAIHDPSAFFELWGTAVDWGYSTVPQVATDGREHKWPRGRVLGGTSSINGMVYLEGDRADYDHWAYLGNSGWSYTDVARCFAAMKASSDETVSDLGLLRPAVVANRSPLSEVFIEACLEIGIPTNPDLNSGDLSGAGWNQSTIFQGRRQSSYRAFVAPIIGRADVEVRTSAHVHRIVVDRTSRARGVVYSKEGTLIRVDATAEVILCAGAIDSPRTLLLSGVGPADELSALGIEPVVDSPQVGRNLVDHMLLGVVMEALGPVENRNPFITESCAFLGSSSGLYGPDIEISFAKEACYAEGHQFPEHCYTIIPGMVRPESRGSVTLRSADPLAPPVIDPHHLEEEADMRVLLRGIEISREIGRSRAFAPWTRGEAVPGPDATDAASLRAYVRRVVSTWFHPVGTCRMGIDSGAVVDPALRVRGVEGLRVVDAAIMPHIVSCNTNAASMMIGWRGGELVAGV